MSASGPGGDALVSETENRRMFDAISRRYDLMNRIISLGQDRAWRRRAVAELGCRSGGRYLDVGSGTGDLALEILARWPGASVIGVDPCHGMLRIGLKKAAAEQTTVRFVAGDAVRLPFRDQSFDGVILGFCIRNVTDRSTALREFHRVLRPGGRLVVLELTVPRNPLFYFGHMVYTGAMIPAISRLFTEKGAYDYLVASVRAFPSAEAFSEQVLACGFAAARAVPLMLGSVTIFSCRR